jgi:hypothetical protein
MLVHLSAVGFFQFGGTDAWLAVEKCIGALEFVFDGFIAGKVSLPRQARSKLGIVAFE